MEKRPVLHVPDGKANAFPAQSGIFVLGGITHMVKKELLDILACPKCKERVVLDETGTHILCKACRVRYPIEDDIPIMLIDRAEALE